MIVGSKEVKWISYSGLERALSQPVALVRGLAAWWSRRSEASLPIGSHSGLSIEGKHTLIFIAPFSARKETARSPRTPVRCDVDRRRVTKV
jgi:hypothetical protein